METIGSRADGRQPQVARYDEPVGLATVALIAGSRRPPRPGAPFQTELLLDAYVNHHQELRDRYGPTSPRCWWPGSSTGWSPYDGAGEPVQPAKL